ncbi:MAG: glycerol-3-phosphate acyltransferase, partial [Cytophagales bacterium]|nr:glycerol-3-phosphate acyltransferase [Cytophagales bacterium]
MEVLVIALGIVLAYVLGSVPTSVWFGRTFHGMDVREYGSGNPGA